MGHQDRWPSTKAGKGNDIMLFDLKPRAYLNVIIMYKNLMQPKYI